VKSITASEQLEFTWIAFFHRGIDQTNKHRMWPQRSGSQARMGLSAHKVRMGRQLKYLHYRLVRGLAGKDQAGSFQLVDITRINFVSVPEPHSNGSGLTEQLRCKCIGLNFYISSAKPHITAESLDLFLFGEDIYYRIGTVGIYLAAVGIIYSANIAGKLYHSRLEAQAQTKVRHIIFSGIFYACYLAIQTAKATSDVYWSGRCRDEKTLSR